MPVSRPVFRDAMQKFTIGKLKIGSVPRVVGTLSEKTAFFSLDSRKPAECDIIEARLDMIGADAHGWMERCRALESAGRPVLLTLRLVADGGKWTAPDKERESIFTKALENLSCIDVEMNSALCRGLCRKAEEMNKKVVVSWHDFKKTPGGRELKERLKRMLANACAIPKIATMINRPADIRTLLDLLEVEPDRPVCIIGMGSRGIKTRVAFPCVGSCLAYGYLDSSVAPGQLSSSELANLLRKLIPEYGKTRGDV
jgi:3-dehydroquinate dehydratase I